MECLRRVWQCMLLRGDRATIVGNIDRTPTLVPTKSTEEDGTTPEEQTKRKKTNPYDKYGLPSPPRGEHRRVDPADAIKSMISDGFRKYKRPQKLGTDISRVLFFLYGRGFFCNEKRTKRVRKIKEIIGNQKVLKHAVRLVANDGDKDVTQECQEQYLTLCQSLIAYFKQSGAFGLRPSTGALKYYFRIQQQGNCFLLAPCIGVGYLMQIKSVADAAPLDLTQFVQHSFDDEKLFKYLVKDAGGDTDKEFIAILQGLSSNADRNSIQCQRLLVSDLTEKEFSLDDHLNCRGPGIVSNFKVHKAFQNHKCSTEGKNGYIRFSGPKLHNKGEFVELGDVGAQARREVEVNLNSYLRLDESAPNPIALERDFNALNHEEEGDDETAAELNEGEGVEVNEGASVAHNEAEAAASEQDETVSEAKKPTLDDGKNKVTGLHAMLLIGGRRDTKGRDWFLLQNMWKDTQLVEVSAAYLKASSATISFAAEDYKFAPANERQNFSLNSSLFADANNFDRAVQTENGLSHPTLERVNH